MNWHSLRVRLRPVALGLILVLFVAGCADIRQGISWPALEALEVDGTTRLLVAYENRVELLDLTSGNLVAIRDSDGEILTTAEGEARRWVLSGNAFENARFFTAPIEAVDNGREALYFPTYDNVMIEVYRDTAEVVSAAGIVLDGGVLARPVVTDELYYIGYRNGDVVALDRESLTEVWRVDTAQGVWGGLALAEGVLYAPSIDHLLYAIDAQSGDVLWQVDLAGAITSAPLLHDGFIYVGSYSSSLYKIDLNGTIVAEHEGRNWVWGTPAIYEEVVYYTDLSGRVYALNSADLSERWVQQPANQGIRPGPLVTDEYVVVASRNGSVYWLDRRSGATIHEREIERRPELLSDLVLVEADEETGIAEPIVVVGSTDNRSLVAAFRLDNSLPLWVYER